jgi:histidine ammonia-lyase
VVPVVPQLGSVGASGDLAPLSHLAIVLLGGGEAFFGGERLPGAEALRRAGLAPVTLGLKEGLALNNGTAQMLATGVLALAKLEDLLDTADLAAAMTIDAFAGRLGAFAPEVHALRPHPGQVHVAAQLRALLDGSTLADIPYARVPGKKVQPQDSYSLRCVPQVHGAVRDAVAQAARVLEIELNSVTDNPLVFPDAEAGRAVISAGHFHGMPLALAMSYVKAAIPVLASISERRLNKLVDPATSDGLPAFLVGNEDGTESGHMIVQYTAAAIVNDLASRAMPASVYSIPTSANAEDHVSMGANEARHVLAMADDLGKVLALELFTAAQALDLRVRMIEGEAHPGRVVAAAHAAIRERIDFLEHDRALDGDVRAAIRMVEDGSVLAAARAAG